MNVSRFGRHRTGRAAEDLQEASRRHRREVRIPPEHLPCTRAPARRAPRVPRPHDASDGPLGRPEQAEAGAGWWSPTSGANHCGYCVVAHGALLRIRVQEPGAGRSGADQSLGSRAPERWRAIVDLALALTRTPEHFGRAGTGTRPAPAGLTETRSGTFGAITGVLRHVEPPRSPVRSYVRTRSSTAWGGDPRRPALTHFPDSRLSTQKWI